MKKVVWISLAMLCIVFISKAQDKKISIGLGFGGASVSAEQNGVQGSGVGINYYLNGMYNVTSNISAGLEYNSSGAVVVFDGGNSDGLKVTGVTGILAKGKYTFGDGGVKPFGGLALGMYTLTPPEVTLNGVVQPTGDKKTNIGFAPEVGVQFGSFQIAASYHFPGTSAVNSGEVTYKLLQFNIGWNIGLIDN